MRYSCFRLLTAKRSDVVSSERPTNSSFDLTLGKIEKSNNKGLDTASCVIFSVFFTANTKDIMQQRKTPLTSTFLVNLVTFRLLMVKIGLLCLKMTRVKRTNFFLGYQRIFWYFGDIYHSIPVHQFHFYWALMQAPPRLQSQT